MSIRSAITRVLFALSAGFLLLGTATETGAGKASASAGGGERTVLGKLDLRTPTGEQVSLVPLISRRAIVIVFWAAWCPICREEVPRLNKLNADPLIKVIAVNEGDSNKKIQSFITAYNVAYQVAVDPDGVVAKAFQVHGMPACVILGRSGLIVYRGSWLPEDIDYYLTQ
jgi:peroxiredoxin